MHTIAVAGVITAMVCGAAIASRADQQVGWGRSPDVHPVLVIHVSGEYDRGYMDRVSGSFWLQTDRFTGLEVTPDRGKDGTAICPKGATFGVLDSERAFGPDVSAAWQIEARLVSVADDVATVDVRWRRRLALPGVALGDRGPIEKRLVLKEGDRGVLDFVPAAADRDQVCGSVAVSLELRFQGPYELESTAIGYDLWLVQQDADGRILTDRFETVAKQSQRVEYFFRPMQYRRDGTRAPANDVVDGLTVNISGAVRGRARSDGLIDLSIEETRFAGTPGNTYANFGRKYLTVRPGETVEIEVPEVKAELPRIGNLAEIFRGQRTSIRVTAHLR